MENRFLLVEVGNEQWLAMKTTRDCTMVSG